MYETKNWDALVLQGVGSKHEMTPTPVKADTATVVDIARRARDDDGEGFEGEGGNCYVIFQVGDRFFKRTFNEGSFSEYDLYWWSDVEEVYGEVETTIKFRPKGK